ncbi:MAG: LptF/LptG family permease [Aestuariivirgaceae bacterium]
MTIIGWMLSRMILMRFLAFLVGITGFVITLQVFTLVDDILKAGGDKLIAVAEYALLLWPVTAATFVAVCALLAVLLTLVELSARNELAAIWGTGVSPYRLVLMLMPIGLTLGGLQFLIVDQAVPRVTPALVDWGIGDYGKKKLAVGEGDPIWLRSGNDILRAGKANASASELDNVIIFRRNASGMLDEQIMASHAMLKDQRWLLEDVVIYTAEAARPSRVKWLVYSGAMRPAAAGSRSGDPEEMSIGDLGYFIRNAGFGIRPAYVYETWWHRRVSMLLTAWLMIAICLPLAVRYRRSGAGSQIFMIGLAIGFTYSIFEGISLTMGETGMITPWIAAWIPLITYSAVGAAIAFRAETVQ